MMGRRKTDPAEARTTFELKGLTVPSPRTTPALPKASEDRRIVPRLPGSCRPARTMMGPTCMRSVTSSRENCLRRTRAATPCGDSLGTRLSNNLSGSRRVSTWAPICGSRRSARSCADSKEYRTETQATADGFFQDAQAFDGTISGFGEFGVGKCLAELLDQGVVAAFNAAEAIVGGGARLFHSLDYRRRPMQTSALDLFGHTRSPQACSPQACSPQACCAWLWISARNNSCWPSSWTLPFVAIRVYLGYTPTHPFF